MAFLKVNSQCILKTADRFPGQTAKSKRKIDLVCRRGLGAPPELGYSHSILNVLYSADLY